MENIKIIYQDEDILLIDKPSGLLSVADGYDASIPHLRTQLETFFGKLWMVHRLDKETSGILVLARNAMAHKVLNEAFRNRQVSKDYHCLVSPVPSWQTTTCHQPLSINTGRRHLTKVDPINGKLAQTTFEVLSINYNIALIKCQIESGYRHQIRAHLYHLGLGILGDKLYKPPQQKLPPEAFPRLMLHAFKLGFVHPRTLEQVCYQAQTPDQFSEILGNVNPKDWDIAA